MSQETYYLLQEDTDKFYCQADTLEEAKEHAETWNAVVLGRVPYAYVNADVNPEDVPMRQLS
mgnify:CR=1 FL=1|tara:strand:- start:3803 stop:3988 length:186 start_codon:yes stop_codon:yes gene_type:complete